MSTPVLRARRAVSGEEPAEQAGQTAHSKPGRNEPLLRTMSSQLTARIRERILAGEYAPGSQLLQDSIAAEFAVSKIPVREALVHLRSEGLVDVYAHRGFQVRRVSVEEMREVFRLRLAIEPAAVGAGALAATTADKAACRAALAALDETLATAVVRNSGDLNSAFHLSLIVPRVQPVTSEVLHRLHTLAERYVRMHLLPPGRMKRASKEHGALFNAWAAGKAKEAERLVRSHIEEIGADLARALAPTSAMRP